MMEQVPEGPVMGLPEAPKTEQIVIALKRHPIGLIVMYGEAFLALIAAIALITFLLPAVFKTTTATAFAMASLIGLLLLIVVGLLLLTATIIYRRSRLIVTTANITQVQQVGLFNRKVSQLSLIDIEDVSAEQKGVMPTMFNYGTLYIETAGEQPNFHFELCPKPNAVAKDITYCQKVYEEQYALQNSK